MSSRPADLTGARRRRRRAAQIRAALRLVTVMAVVAVLGGVVWLAAFSPVLAATSVVVKGSSLLSADEVKAAAQVPLGTPLLRLNPAPVAERVRTLAPVQSVDVSRQWPRTVVITVTERRPAYALRGGDGAYTLVDAAGIPYQRVETAPEGLLPVEVAVMDTRLLGDVATVVGALPEAVRSRATSVTVTTVDHIVIKLDGGRILLWGSAEQSELKAQVAAALMKVQASAYDVSAPSRPATRP